MEGISLSNFREKYPREGGELITQSSGKFLRQSAFWLSFSKFKSFNQESYPTMVHLWNKGLRYNHDTFGNGLASKFQLIRSLTGFCPKPVQNNTFFQNRAVLLFWSQLSQFSLELSVVYGVGKYIHRTKSSQKKSFQNLASNQLEIEPQVAASTDHSSSSEKQDSDLKTFGSAHSQRIRTCILSQIKAWDV